MLAPELQHVERTAEAATLAKILDDAISAGDQTRADVALAMIEEKGIAHLLCPDGSFVPYRNQLDLVNDVERAFRERAAKAETSQVGEDDSDVDEGDGV